MTTPQVQGPWMDFRLKKEMMDHLQNAIDNPPSQPETAATNSLAGNISKSNRIEDKDDLFREGVLNGVSDNMYFSDWNNYYDVHIAKTIPNPKFKLEKMWVNYQKQHEFNPPHFHASIFSFVVFMKIPTHWKEQHALPISANSNSPQASDFQFLLGQGRGEVQIFNIPLSPEDEGRMLFFPAWLRHQVFPFYGTEEERITISGNIVEHEPREDMKTLLKKEELLLEETEIKARTIRMTIDKIKQTNPTT